jgi:hypothetical protein
LCSNELISKVTFFFTNSAVIHVVEGAIMNFSTSAFFVIIKLYELSKGIHSKFSGRLKMDIKTQSACDEYINIPFMPLIHYIA